MHCGKITNIIEVSKNCSKGCYTVEHSVFSLHFITKHFSQIKKYKEKKQGWPFEPNTHWCTHHKAITEQTSSNVIFRVSVKLY